MQCRRLSPSAGLAKSPVLQQSGRSRRSVGAIYSTRNSCAGWRSPKSKPTAWCPVHRRRTISTIPSPKQHCHRESRRSQCLHCQTRNALVNESRTDDQSAPKQCQRDQMIRAGQKMLGSRFGQRMSRVSQRRYCGTCQELDASERNAFPRSVQR